MTPTMATAGTTQNTVPDLARVTVDVRAPDSVAQEELDAALRRMVADTARLPFEITGGVNRPPLEETRAREPLALARSVFGRLGLDWPGSARVGGVSDGICAPPPALRRWTASARWAAARTPNTSGRTPTASRSGPPSWP